VRSSNVRPLCAPERSAALEGALPREIVPALTEQFGYTNPHQVPGIVKVVVNTGVGEAAKDSKVIEGAIKPTSPRLPARSLWSRWPQVHRPVQAARGNAHWRSRHPARNAAWEFVDRLVNLGASSHQRLPWLVGQAVRRKRKLHLRSDRADGVSRNQPGQH
jgi:hypothetical protein